MTALLSGIDSQGRYGAGLSGSVPNLDALDTADLYSLVAITKGAGAGRKNKLPNSVAGLINQYARNKITAIACRERGEIDTALRYERICDSIYQQFPEQYRW